MKQHIFSLLFSIFCVAFTAAQTAEVKGRVIDSNSGQVIPDTSVSIEGSVFSERTNSSGTFSISGLSLPQGEQVLVVEKSGYLTKRIPINIQVGSAINLDPIVLENDFTDFQTEIGTIILADDELDEDVSGADNISGLLQASRDLFLSAAAFDFSSTFFRPRGLDTQYSKVLINGVEMNKMFSGRPLWANWGGMNDAQRNQEFTKFLGVSDYNFGGAAGMVNVNMRASQYREGGRVTYSISNRSYTGRVMGSYSSGMQANGWAYSVLISRRYGNEGFFEGTPYSGNSFFASVEKKFSDDHYLNFTGMYAPTQRGRSSANTQEMVDIKGIQYNSFWGMQDGKIRNSRIFRTEEPIFMLNHNINVGKEKRTTINTNIAYQFGEMGGSRIGQDNVPHSDPSYYRYLPSFDLSNPAGPNYENAYRNLIRFQNDGQVEWNRLYATNIAYGGPARYYVFEDRNDDSQLTANTIVTTRVNENLTLNGMLSYRSLRSENFANMIDLLGADNYLDVDIFNLGDAQQNDLQNPDRIIGEGDKFRYNFEYLATEMEGFLQAQFKYKKIDFYLAANLSKTQYQRNGLYQNGSFPDNSLGKSEKLDFDNFGGKGGLTYKITGKHLIDFNAAYYTQAPTIRNSFSNARQNNAVVAGLESETIQNVDLSYIYRSPIIKAQATAYYTALQDGTEISFYYADGLAGISRNATNAFVQEVLTGVDRRHIGAELAIEAQVTPTIKLKGVASIGDFVYTNNPNLYLTSDDFADVLDYGESYMKNYHLPGGPQQAYQIGFEYRDPNFWWVGATANHFSHAYLDVSPLTRTRNFYTDIDGAPFNDYDPELARELLRQERFDSYMLVNVVGGKSWRINNYYVGFFATINNVFGQEYKTGGFEQSRNANFRSLRDDNANGHPVFGPRYWFGTGTTYFLNVYVRF